jgi:antitoxin ParD1/3/4
MTVKPSISLTDEQHAFASRLVASGRYASLSAVLQQGLDALRQRIEAEEAETAALHALLARRSEGPFIDGNAMDARLDALIARRRAARGLSD